MKISPWADGIRVGFAVLMVRIFIGGYFTGLAELRSCVLDEKFSFCGISSLE